MKLSDVSTVLPQSATSKMGTDKFSMGTDAYTMGTDKFTMGLVRRFVCLFV